nr:MULTISPECIES: CPBP family intramembrane glutamic endopeptidase [Macrococcus]
MMLITFLAAPVIEEFIFRYLLFRKDAKYPINIVSAIISSFVFGVVHGKDMILTIPLIINGLIYCLVYHKSNNIFVSIVTHSIFNIFIFIMLISNIR